MREVHSGQRKHRDPKGHNVSQVWGMVPALWAIVRAEEMEGNGPHRWPARSAVSQRVCLGSNCPGFYKKNNLSLIFNGDKLLGQIKKKEKEEN